MNIILHENRNRKKFDLLIIETYFDDEILLNPESDNDNRIIMD